MSFLIPLFTAGGGAAATGAAAGAAAQGAAMGAAASATAAAAGASAASTAGLLGSLSSIYTGVIQPIMGVMSVVSPFIAAGSTAALANQQIALANQQASLTEYQIKNMEQASALRASERRKQFRKSIGTQLSLYSVSGVDPTQGTPVDVMSDTAKTFAGDQFLDDFDTQNRIYSNMIRAKNTRAYGRQQATGTLLNYAMRTVERGNPFAYGSQLGVN